MKKKMPIIVLALLLAGLSGTAAYAADGAVPAGVPPLALLSRWAHILAAVVMLGGAVFLRFILMPSITEAFGATGHQTLRPVLMRRWRKVVHGCIAVFLVSGFYNYLAVTAPRHAGQPLYHALFGVKFLLGLAIFALASILVSGRDRSSPIRANAPLWMAVTVALGVTVVMIGGAMKLL